MNWTAKARTAISTGTSSTSAVATARAKPGPSTAAPSTNGNVRVSNGLKEFLWLISDVERARVLDLGQVFQSTLNFFIERGCRISTEDLLRSWKDFLTTEEERLRQAPIGQGGERVSQAALADKFLETALQYPEDTYHGVLAWDLFDYLDAELLPRVMERLYKLLSPGGSVLAQFHSRAPERFHRYRLFDSQTIELLPAPTISVHARVFQNREILDIFGQFRTSKTFVGRDQVREALFLK
jgi:hypothetical protein